MMTRLLPSEKKAAIAAAMLKFEEQGTLEIYEPCDCGGRIRHNNGGNYHEEIYLIKDEQQVFVKYESSCELVDRAEWEPCEDWQAVIEEHADWLPLP